MGRRDHDVRFAPGTKETTKSSSKNVPRTPKKSTNPPDDDDIEEIPRRSSRVRTPAKNVAAAKPKAQATCECCYPFIPVGTIILILLTPVL